MKGAALTKEQRLQQNYLVHGAYGSLGLIVALVATPLCAALEFRIASAP
jgi:hypothetical protein